MYLIDSIVANWNVNVY